MKRLRHLAADFAGRAAAGLVWALVIAAAILLAAVCGVFLIARHVWRILLAWPQPLVTDADRQALLGPAYDMDAELARLIEEEEARQRRPRDGGSVRGWLAVSTAVVGVTICSLVIFVLAALNIGGFQ